MTPNEHYILKVGNVWVDSTILTEPFCCDTDRCKGACCVEGDSGAPLTMDEIGDLEDALDAAMPLMTAEAVALVEEEGVACIDNDGDLVTPTVNGRDCAFACHTGQTCLCAIEKTSNKGHSAFSKPISCALYPIREKAFPDGTIAIKYHRWALCDDARVKGKQLGLPLYQFLKVPLIRRFGHAWYDELCQTANSIQTKP